MKNKGRKHKALGTSGGMNCKGSLTHITRPIESMSPNGEAGIFSGKSARFDKKKWSKRVRGYLKTQKSEILNYEENMNKSEKEVFMSDEMYLPISYKGDPIKKPVYSGNGNHSISELEKICQQYEEYAHQQQIIKQNCMRHIVELKFGSPAE